MEHESSSPLHNLSDSAKEIFNSSFSSTSLDDLPNNNNNNMNTSTEDHFPLTEKDFELSDDAFSSEEDFGQGEDRNTHEGDEHGTTEASKTTSNSKGNNYDEYNNGNSRHSENEISKPSSANGASEHNPEINSNSSSHETSGNIEADSNTVLEVAQHYNRRPDLGVSKRKESRIFKLRSFNNWVKSLLIGCTVKKGDTVLDLGCGKGGDLMKFSRANASRYVGADIAAVSVEQAMTRYQLMRGAKFDAKFFVHDCFGKSTSTIFPAHFQADVVSLQFCLHYSFETEEKARMMLSNVTNNLKVNGKFIGTIPDANRIIKKLRSSDGLKFGNSIYNIRFENKDNFQPFGSKYWFHLEDAIDDCPEYLVHFGTFAKLASEYGLTLIEHFGFHEYYENYCKHPDFNDLLYRMDVISSEGPDEFPEDEWEAIGLYKTFIMEKTH